MPMVTLSAKQIKAGRALLDWAQNDLAAATNLSVTTIRNLESDDMSGRGATLQVIRQVMESAGIEFLDSDGVRCRNDNIKVFQGLECCDGFLDDMIRAVSKKGGNVEIIISFYHDLLRVCGLMASDHLMPLAEISQITTIKCLLSEIPKLTSNIPAFEFRVTAKQNILLLPCFIYDSHCAFAMPDSTLARGFVALRINNGFDNCRQYFHTHWEAAQPIFLDEYSSRRIRAS